MKNELFLSILAASFAVLFVWAFRALPKERWQIIAAVPLAKDVDGEWRGLNLTYYGFFQAVSNSFAVAIAFVLFGAVGIKLEGVFALAGILFALCWPAAKLITRVVEKKRHLFTVGGAVFVGTLVLPWAICLLNHLPSGSAWLQDSGRSGAGRRVDCVRVRRGAGSVGLHQFWLLLRQKSAGPSAGAAPVVYVLQF